MGTEQVKGADAIGPEHDQVRQSRCRLMPPNGWRPSWSAHCHRSSLSPSSSAYACKPNSAELVSQLTRTWACAIAGTSSRTALRIWIISVKDDHRHATTMLLDSQSIAGDFLASDWDRCGTRPHQHGEQRHAND